VYPDFAFPVKALGENEEPWTGFDAFIYWLFVTAP
jgi:hypothetical protein